MADTPICVPYQIQAPDPSTEMSNSLENHKSRFVEQLTGSQRHLYAYINTLLGGDSAVVDVLQVTNVDVGREIIGPRKPESSATRVAPGEKVDDVASVWKLQVEKPAEVVLGPVIRGPRGAGSMYGIVAVSDVPQPD